MPAAPDTAVLEIFHWDTEATQNTVAMRWQLFMQSAFQLVVTHPLPISTATDTMDGMKMCEAQVGQ